jgi:hypothetical protein
MERLLTLSGLGAGWRPRHSGGERKRPHAAPIWGRKGLGGGCRAVHDITHFESLSILNQYSTNELLNGKDAADGVVHDFKRKKY